MQRRVKSYLIECGAEECLSNCTFMVTRASPVSEGLNVLIGAEKIAGIVFLLDVR